MVTSVVAAVSACGTSGKYLQIYNCRVPLGFCLRPLGVQLFCHLPQECDARVSRLLLCALCRSRRQSAAQRSVFCNKMFKLSRRLAQNLAAVDVATVLMPAAKARKAAGFHAQAPQCLYNFLTCHDVLLSRCSGRAGSPGKIFDSCSSHCPYGENYNASNCSFPSLHLPFQFVIQLTEPLVPLP